MKREPGTTLSRRDFLKGSLVGLAVGLPKLTFGSNPSEETMKTAKIALVKTHDRKKGVQEVMRLFDISPMSGKKVYIKPNFNTADLTPGSTHQETLSQLVKEIKEREAAEIILGERSGPPPTKKVMEDLGIFDLSRELGFGVVNFEDLEDKDWVHFNPPGNHWTDGFYIARPAAEAEYVVTTCCLKTHQYGGVFTMSLKLSVGLTPKKLMRELHRSPDMRAMIAEINLGYQPELIVLDGVEAFVDGGPMTGERKTAGVFLSGTDRIAIDAVGLAILKELGSNQAIMGKKIFSQEQIARAVELGLGVRGPDKIEFVTQDEESRQYAQKLKAILAEG